MASTHMALLAVLALCLCADRVSGQKVTLPCERITGIEYCTECDTEMGECTQCAWNYYPVWTAATGKMKSCKISTKGAACQKASQDPNCQRCSNGVVGSGSSYCVLCKTGYAFNDDFQCGKTTTPSKVSGNPNCAAFTPDTRCTACKTGTGYLLPQNAAFMNNIFPLTRCMKKNNLNNLALKAILTKANPPKHCMEVDTLFQCARCANKMTLAADGKCYPDSDKVNGSGCKPGIKYRQYCQKCNASGERCVICNGYRTPNSSGQCTTPCKEMFGISCLSCVQKYCTAVDPDHSPTVATGRTVDQETLQVAKSRAFSVAA